MPTRGSGLLRLTGIASGQGYDADIEAIDDFVVSALIQREVQDPASPLTGRSPDELMKSLEPRRGPERISTGCCDPGLRRPFGADSDGLALEKLEASTASTSGRWSRGCRRCCVPRAARSSSRPSRSPMTSTGCEPPRARRQRRVVLVGRRAAASNNSWMHNVPQLVKGKERCTAHVHPDDAERFGLIDGEQAQVTSRAGSIVVPVEVTDASCRGSSASRTAGATTIRRRGSTVAAEHAGANSNLLADEELIDPLSGNAVLNGIPVELSPVRSEQAAAVA